MKINISNSYNEMSAMAARDIISHISELSTPLFCPTSGDTPTGLYEELVKYYASHPADIQGWSFVGLDEWMGMDGRDEGSCRFNVDHQLFLPLAIKESNICFFDGRSKDPSGECKKVENFIDKFTTIDLAVVGLGQNGHVGMNEPGTNEDSRCHIAEIAAETQETGQKYFKESRSITQGMTLGIANLLEAKHLFMIVNGSKKAAIVKKLVEGPISEDIPASFLRRHPGFSIYLDKEAAKMLSA